jgi:hypothetical protein
MDNKKLHPVIYCPMCGEFMQGTMDDLGNHMTGCEKNEAGFGRFLTAFIVNGINTWNELAENKKKELELEKQLKQ